MLRDNDDVVLCIAQRGADQFVDDRHFVAILVRRRGAFDLREANGDEAALARGVVLRQLGLLDLTAAGGEHQVLRIVVIVDRQHLLDVFARFELQQVRHMLALGVTSALRHLVGLQTVDATLVGEEQQPVVRAGEEEVVHYVVFAQTSALDSLAAAMLRAVFVDLRALDEAAVRHSDDDVLIGDEVFHVDFAGIRQDAGATVVTVLFDDFVEFVTHDRALAFLAGEDVVVVGDLALQFLVLVQDLLAFEGCETAQLHGEDGVRLHIVHVKQVHEACACGIHGGGAADEGDHLVDHVEGLQVALQNVVAFLRFALEVAGAAFDDFELMIHPVLDERVEAERARHAVHEGEHVGAERLLQLRVLVQVVEHDLRHGVALEHQHEALAGAARGFVAHVGDATDLAVAHRFADRHDKAIGIDLVGQFRDDKAHASADFLGVDDCTHRDEAASGAVGLFDALVPQDCGAGREVRTLDAGDESVEQLFAACLRVFQRPVHAIGDLAHVVGWNVGGHAHGDATGTVDQQVGEAAGQHDGLLRLAVVVGLEVNGVLVDVAHHFHGERGHAALRVTHGGRGIVARGAEVALSVHEQVAHAPRLCHAHEGVVDGGIAVRMVLAHHVAHDAGALVVAAVGTVAAVIHRVDHATVHRLHAVAHIGERTLHDHGQRIRQV